MNSERDFYPPKQYEEIDAHLLSETIEELLNTLTLREKIVIECRIFNKMTLQKTGELYHVSRERVRQIQSRALKKLRHPHRAKKLISFYDPDWYPLEAKIKEAEEQKKANEAERLYQEKHQKEKLANPFFQTIIIQRTEPTKATEPYAKDWSAWDFLYQER